jgi:mRNA-degrading endonuclease toxin of MazEF toxin-antitoxin module
MREIMARITKAAWERERSVAITSQVVPVDRRRLLDRIGRVPDALMEDINRGLRLSLAL